MADEPDNAAEKLRKEIDDTEGVEDVPERDDPNVKSGEQPQPSDDDEERR